MGVGQFAMMEREGFVDKPEGYFDTVAWDLVELVEGDILE